MKLVEWPDGTYGVVRGWITKEAVGHDGYWWFTQRHWPHHCGFPTPEAAQQAAGIDSYKQPYKTLKSL